MLEFPTFEEAKPGIPIQPTRPHPRIDSRVPTIAPSSLTACRRNSGAGLFRWLVADQKIENGLS
jgi:hypothetical protein